MCTPNGEVTLKISMDVSAVTGQPNIGGISQPIIGQRKIEHEIRLKDGEANLLGGIMEDQQTKSLSGIPGLAQIPILKYLFGQTTQDHSENEIVFAIVPHIIRGTDVNEMNQRAIEIGTANTISLRHVSRPAVTPVKAPAPAAAAPAAPAPLGLRPRERAPLLASQPSADMAQCDRVRRADIDWLLIYFANVSSADDVRNNSEDDLIFRVILRIYPKRYSG